MNLLFPQPISNSFPFCFRTLRFVSFADVSKMPKVNFAKKSVSAEDFCLRNKPTNPFDTSSMPFGKYSMHLIEQTNEFHLKYNFEKVFVTILSYSVRNLK